MISATGFLPLARSITSRMAERWPSVDAEELWSEAQLQLVLVCRAYDSTRHPEQGSWVAWALKRRLIDFLRKELGWRRRCRRFWSLEFDPPGKLQKPTLDFDDYLSRCFLVLAKRDRILARDYFVDGLTAKKAAIRSGSSTVGVQYRLRIIRQILGEFLLGRDWAPGRTEVPVSKSWRKAGR